MKIEEEEARADYESFGSINPEFIAHLNSPQGRPFVRSESVPTGENLKDNKKFGFRKAREDVTSRSRIEIINWVLASEELCKVCICPYCLKIHSRRDNTRTHIKKDHLGLEVREFVQGVDANLDHVRRVNEVGKFPRLLEKRPRTSPTPIENSVSPIVESTEEPEMKIFNNQNPLEEFLNKINEITQQNGDMSEVNGATEASTSASAMDMPVSLKGSREPTPNSSVLDGTDISDSPPQHVFNPMLPFGCVFCPCSFGQIKDLTFHVGHVHRTRYRCNCCLAEFVQSQQLENHYTMAHVIGGEGAETRNSQ